MRLGGVTFVDPDEVADHEPPYLQKQLSLIWRLCVFIYVNKMLLCYHGRTIQVFVDNYLIIMIMRYH